MKKTLLILFAVCSAVQFSLGQAAIDTNSNCNKATLIVASETYKPIIDNFTNSKYEAYYTFVATSTNAKLVVKSKIFNYYVFDGQAACNLVCCGKVKGFYSVNIPFENLTIGQEYSYVVGKYDKGLFETAVLNINSSFKEDLPHSANAKTITENIPFNFSINNYTKGRETDKWFIDCNTTKADSNIVDLFIKFIATSTTATLDLNLNNASLESRLYLKQNYTCKPIQKNTNVRTDTFTGLTIGTDYTVRIEIGGDAALGYARTSSANNASITLVGGPVTGLENDAQPTFSIAPNPSNGSFTFVSDSNADLVIYDLLGTKAGEFKNVSSNQTIELQLEKGIYLLNVSTEKGSKVEKLVIE